MKLEVVPKERRENGAGKRSYWDGMRPFHVNCGGENCCAKGVKMMVREWMEYKQKGVQLLF